MTITFSEIRLGWLQRFCSVLRNGSYAKAGQECHTDATCVSDSVQALERELRQFLIWPDTPRPSGMGRRLYHQLEEMLPSSCLRRASLVNAKIGWLESLVKVVECGSYTAAAKALGRTRDNVMRGVKELQKCFDDPLIARQGRMYWLTPAGEQAAASLGQLKDILTSVQGDGGRVRERSSKRYRPWFTRTPFYAPAESRSQRMDKARSPHGGETD